MIQNHNIFHFFEQMLVFVYLPHVEHRNQQFDESSSNEMAISFESLHGDFNHLFFQIHLWVIG
jgi:hypothetical protein